MMKHIALTLSLLLGLLCASYGQMQMGMRGQGKPIYYPFQLDSIFYWYDAMDASSLLDSVGGAVGNNEGVATWADKSGRNWDVTQSTNGARPVYKSTGGPGGNTPALQFDGSNDFLASAAHWWGSDDITIFVVVKFANATKDASESVIGKFYSTTNERQWRLYGTGAATSYLIYTRFARDGGAANNSDIQYSAKSASWKVHSIINSASTHVAFEDGADSGAASVVTGTGDWTIYDNANNYLELGAVNSRGTPTAFLQGSISEIIVYSRALTADERVGVEEYLQAKWGL